MRLAIGAAMAAMLFGAQALAQETTTPATPATPAPVESRCAPLTDPPAQIDGATATRAQMSEWAPAYEAWGQATLAALACRRDEAEELRLRREALVDAYNAANQRLGEVNAAAQAEVAEFNAR